MSTTSTTSAAIYPDTLALPEVYEGGAGTPLVLIHGFGGNWRMWKPVLAQLEKHHRVIVPTLPGHSGGTPYSGKVTPSGIADALAAQLRARGLEQVHVVGQSLGGYMAIEMARRGVARSVMGVSPAGAWAGDHHYQALLKRIGGTFRLLPYLKPLLSPLMSSASLRKRFLRDEMEHGDRMSAAEVRGMLDHGLRCTIASGFLSSVIPQVEPLPADNQTPLRILWCGNDRVLTFTEFGQPLLDRLGLKTHRVLPGCGHNPMYDDPDTLAQEILDFTRAVESGTA
jgi:pimeloyl-ACP methyl ester carboxylesterase